MSKQVTLGADARKKLVEGIDILADAVVSTLGPNGRNIIISKPQDYPVSTKDGVSVAKSISLKDPEQELGVQLVKQAAIKTAEKAGDGTTTSTLLAREMVKEGLNALNNGENAVQIKRDIDSSVKLVIQNLKEVISKDISSEDQLEQVATISANNDPEIGKLISTAIDKVGMEGVVHIEESRTGDTYLETVEGMQFERGYKSPYFVTNNTTMSAILENPLILISENKITQVKELLPILEAVSSQDKSLLIIAEDIDQEALATLIVNKMRGTMKVCAVKAPDFGDRRKLILEDIAITTGGQVFSRDKGMKLDKFSWDWFGEARTITVEKELTTIVDGKGNEEKINDRIDELQNQLVKSTTPFETEKLQERLAKFIGGVAIIHVGGNTETEMKEKKDRVDDALHATKAAIEEGIVPGGGMALLCSSNTLVAETTGAKIVKKACKKPFIQILINAGYENTEAEILAADLLTRPLWSGYNIKTKTIVDMSDEGIIDPTKVSRTALQNAASVAGTILLTEGTVVDLPESNDSSPQMDPSMMMGM